MTSPHLTDTQFQTFRIFRPNWLGKLFSRKCTLFEVTIRCQSSKEDIPKTAVITPFGLFEFLRMPFGLKNAAQTFQRMIDSILRDLDFLFVYLNDILVASASRREHLTHLQLLFARLGQHGLIINPAKWQFGLAAIDFLVTGSQALGQFLYQTKSTLLQSSLFPHTTKALQEFLGMVNFYHRFIFKQLSLCTLCTGPSKDTAGIHRLPGQRR